MRFDYLLIPTATALAAALLVACGGASSGVGSTPTSGLAVDGYLSGSKVVCDSNDNGVAGAGETTTYTDTRGNFTFPSGCKHGVIVSGGTSVDTGLAFVGQLRSPAGATMVTPLTTLIASGMTQTELNKALDLPTGTDLLTTDPAATNANGELKNPSLMKKTLAVQQLLQKTTELFVGLGSLVGSQATNTVYTEVAAAFAEQLKTGDALMNDTDGVSSDRVNTLVSAAVTRTSTASTVSSDIKTALASAGGATTIATVVKSALTSQAQEIMDGSNSADITAKTKDRQGNTSIVDTVKVAVASGEMGPSTSAEDADFLDRRLNTVAVKPTEAVAPTDYVYLDNNSIGFSADGVSATTYSVSDFQSSTSGIRIKWPMADSAALKLKLKANGSFTFAPNQKLSAAVRIQEKGGGSGEVRAFTDNVTVSKSGDDIILSVPDLPQALIYGVSGNAQTKAVIDFASKVKGITNTLSTASGAESTVMFGEVVNYGINGLSNQFAKMSEMRGKYLVTIVVNELPLRKADGSKFDFLSIDVPTTLSGGAPGSHIPVTGYGLVGYITLTD